MTMYPLGAIPDIADKRDYPIARFLAKGVALPEKLDLSNLNLPQRNQGQEGACVAFSACGAKESQEGKEGYLSPRFLYERIKHPGGGAYPRDAMKVLLDIGVPPESCQPYNDTTITPECQNALELAKQNKIRAYARLQTLDEMKQCLNQYGCFTIAVAVTNNWFNVGLDGFVAPAGGEIVGYHQVEFVGYDNSTRRIKFKNSWGNWGENGYGYLGYSYLMEILEDAYSFVDIPEAEEEKPAPVPKKKTWLEQLWEWLFSWR